VLSPPLKLTRASEKGSTKDLASLGEATLDLEKVKSFAETH